MSSPILPEDVGSAPMNKGLRARVCVALALAMSALPPRLLVGTLRLAGRGGRAATPETVSSCRRAVVSVSARCAGEGCVPRSVATFLLARSYGSVSSWRAGIRPNPFLAHAWVEVDGVPVDEPEAVRDFIPTLKVDPGSARPSA
ncbi:hypothetical protein LP52_05065 [Streptomonospora alba]|uniref:Microcin J25-processing protein McjB C-terminal domain-containing protein n=1 Tax=Streptomonospora alba TaxID=183763 RepID=A0A0C2FJY6_9ACTN|nr:lasso peptide biosynthesis B2 protein [Streptomonospora alba]KIH99639.1 hypothetical protein LP52_05065 [Streptomonospora alba]